MYTQTHNAYMWEPTSAINETPGANVTKHLTVCLLWFYHCNTANTFLPIEMSISFTFYDHSTTDQVLFASSEFFFFFLFTYLIERERECVQGVVVWAEGEGKKQIPCWEQNLQRGGIPRNRGTGQAEGRLWAGN